MSAGEFSFNLANMPWMIVFGLIVGALGGFFGVGGGFLMVPMLNVVFGLPYNVAVGSDLGQMCGMSTAATVRHMRFGNIDFKLATLMIVGTATGVEAGARILEVLKHAGSIMVAGKNIDLMTLIMSGVYAALLIFLGQAMIRESMRTLRREAGQVEMSSEVPASGYVLKIRGLKLWPMVSLPASGIESISLWVILGIGFATGLLSGMLGVGGGFIRMPALVYIMGCPTVVAVGTDLFEIMFSAAFGVATHGFKGNVHLVVVLALLIGTTVGAQIGASYTRRAGGPRVRFGFGALAFVGVLMVVVKLALKLTMG
ncbi:MAG: sulfite exporter TauE/SafE family protein [Deltaproteobacteria bacterium]|nr:sulfite exporter TauE/SafE family protein [Deltaproteobacteria bacterium]